jgi:hypothetical protein
LDCLAANDKFRAPYLPDSFVTKAAMNIKVLIVDNSPVMGKAVRQLLSEESGIEIVGEASSLSRCWRWKNGLNRKS